MQIMTGEQLNMPNPATLTLEMYSQLAHQTNQLQIAPHLLDDAAARRYLSAGICEERGEIEGLCDDSAYSRSQVLRAPFYYASRYREQLRSTFPEQVALHEKEFGDLLWYMSERLRAEPALPGQELSLHTAANEALRAIDPQATPITTFAQLDQHCKDHPLALRMPHPLHGKSLPEDVDDLFERPIERWDGEIFPVEVEPVYASELLFDDCLNGVVRAIDQLDNDPDGRLRAELHPYLLVNSGKVLWMASFILQERLGGSLAQTAVTSLQKTAARVAKGNVFGSGDAR